MTESPVEHEGHVLEHIVGHDGLVTLHTCDACVTPERLIQIYEQLIVEVKAHIKETS